MKNKFKHYMNLLIENNESYRKVNPELGYAVTDKGHIVYKLIVKEIPEILKSYIDETKMKNHEYINVKGSTGDGRIGNSYWIALLDERITLTTTEGIYIVFLFDLELEYLYLTIASGTENRNLTDIKNQSKFHHRYFEYIIKNNYLLDGFSTESFTLGNSDRAKKFAASVFIHKQYSVQSINFEELVSDLNLLNEEFYKYIFNTVFLEIEEGIPNNESTDEGSNRRSIISVRKHKELLKEKEKRDYETGKLAEEFIYNYEKERLRSEGRPDLAKKVKWLAREQDGYGYDILSFNKDGTSRYIEVKGSRQSKENFVYYLSRNEKEVAIELADSYVLILVENVGTENIRIFKEITNPINELIGTLESIKFKGIIPR